MHICPYGAMAIFILNKISLLEPKAPNRVRSASFPAVTDLRSRSHGWDYIEQNIKFRKERMIEREKKRMRNQMKER